MTQDELYYRAVLSEDSRFDGRLYIGVTSTGIYCRPTCPAPTPKRANMRFFGTAAAAQEAGFRACKRCRPDASPGSPEWNSRADLAGRAMRLIADGLVDREGVTGLAARLNYSERQLRRQLVTEVGASPLALARAQRVRTAQLLLETTDLPVSEVAFAAGFASIRQFNEVVRQVFALTPTQVRVRASAAAGGAARRAERPATGGGVPVRLPFRTPLDLPALLAYLGERAVPGVEEYRVDEPGGGVYRRSLALPHGAAVVSFRGRSLAPPGPADRRRGIAYVRCELHLEDMRDLTAAVQRCRRLLDLDADPRAVDEFLSAGPLLAPLVAAAPGRRVPGCVDADELAVRAALGQGVPRATATAVAAGLVARYGKPLTTPVGAVTHVFPAAAALAEVDPGDLPVPALTRRALAAMTAALAEGWLVLDAGADRDEAAERLRRVDGIEPGTAGDIRTRALGDPDVFVPADPRVRAALAALDAATDSAERVGDAWRPWRSYATQHLLAVAGRG